MLSGGSETVTNSVQPPVKPWETATGPSVDSGANLVSTAFAPPPLPPPFPQSQSQDAYFSNNSIPNWHGLGNPSSNYYGNSYNRSGYFPNYGTGYNSYSSPYYMNNSPFGGVPPAPGSFITSSLENTTRPLFDSVNHVLQAINHVACFVDSTVFAVWTSVTAAGSIIATFKNIKNVHVHKWADAVRRFIGKIRLALKTSLGRKRIILIASILASVPVLIKALHEILRINDTDEKSLIIREDENLTADLSGKPSELSTKALFVRAIYAYAPVDKNIYLSLNPGDVILISKDDESKLNGPAPTWIAGKLKDGSSGYFPSNYVSVIK